MVRRILLLSSLMVTAAFLSSASAQSWKFVKVFPDTNLTFGAGINNTIAVDPNGRVWMTAEGGGTDSILTSAGTYAKTWDIFVYNGDGSLYKKYDVLNFNGTPDTLFQSAAGYGMTQGGPNGNIYVLRNSLTLREIDYKTGDEIAKVVNPIPGYASSCASPAVDSLGEVFMQPVVPTSGVGPVAIAPDFSSTLISVDTSTYGGFTRTIAVSKNGNDVFAPNFTGKYTLLYQSSNGTLGPYVVSPDTLFKGMVLESMGWQPKTGYLWVSAGNPDAGPPDAPYTANTWYGFDMTNPASPVMKDSLTYSAVPAWIGIPRARGIAFSPSGDTAYVGAFDINTYFCEQFVNTATPVVERPNNLPTSYSLSQNYPNPFNPTTKIDYALKATGSVSLTVYDVLGREVATLVNGVQSAGQHSVTFNASNFASGVYFYALTTPDGVRLTKKMILMK